MPSWNGSVFSGTPLLASYRPGALHPLDARARPARPARGLPAARARVARARGPAHLPLRPAARGRAGGRPRGRPRLRPRPLPRRPPRRHRASSRPPPRCRSCFSPRRAHLARAAAAATAAALAVAVALLLLAGSTEAVGAGALLLGARLAARLRPARLRGDGAERCGRSGARRSSPASCSRRRSSSPRSSRCGEAGPGGPGAAGHAAAPLAGLAGLVVRYVSHTPAAVFALAAVPLLASLPALRPVAAVAGLGLLALRRARAAETRAGPAARLRLRARSARRAVALRPVARPARAARPPPATAGPRRLPVRRGVPVGRDHRDRPARARARGARRASSPSASSSTSLSPRGATRRWPTSSCCPLLASFLLQPSGREAWAGAPTVAELEQATPTREALDHAMGERRAERTLTLATSWPRARERRPRLGESREPHRSPQRQRLRPHGARLPPRRARRHGLGRHRFPRASSRPTRDGSSCSA